MPIQHATYAVPREDLREAIMEYDPSLDGYIAEAVLPVRPVKKKAATLSVVTRENLQSVATTHANAGTFNRVGLYTEDHAYACTDYGLEAPLSDEDRANYDSDYDAELETVMDAKHKLLIAQEIRTAALVFNTTTWTGAALYTDVSAAPWDAAGSDAIGHILAAREKVRVNTGFNPDTLVIGAVTLKNMLLNTAILAKFPGAAAITEGTIRSNLAAIVGLENLLVGGRIYSTNEEGLAFAGADVWSDDYAMICRVNQGSLRSGGLGRTMLWTDMTPENITVKQYREEQTDSDIFRVRQFCDEEIFDAYFGHLLKVDA